MSNYNSRLTSGTFLNQEWHELRIVRRLESGMMRAAVLLSSLSGDGEEMEAVEMLSLSGDGEVWGETSDKRTSNLVAKDLVSNVRR